MRLTIILRAFVCLLPMSAVKRVLLNALGYRIAPGARIAPNLVWGVEEIALAPGSHIGTGNVLRNLRSVTLESNAGIGQWNWITGGGGFPTTATSRRLSMARDSAVTSRHYLDTTGGISIGSFGGIGGVRTTVLTHGVDFVGGRQTAEPVTIGDYCLLNSNLVVLAGTVVQDRVVVGAHSLVANTLKSDGLYLSPAARRQR